MGINRVDERAIEVKHKGSPHFIRAYTPRAKIVRAGYNFKSMEP